jgi:hypothetical protein
MAAIREKCVLLRIKRRAAGMIAMICLSFGNLNVAFGEVTYEYAGDLNGLCASGDPATKAVCFGFVGGVLEIVANSPVYGLSACISPLTPLSKAVDVTKKWLTVHPEYSAKPASLAIAQALAEAFPCNR